MIADSSHEVQAALARLDCGPDLRQHGQDDAAYFPYRSSSYITEFFEEIGIDYKHYGSTRKWWVADVLEKILAEPREGPTTPPDTFLRVIDRLMDQADALNESSDRPKALELLNIPLNRAGFEAFYAKRQPLLRAHIGTNTVAATSPDPHRPLSPAEGKSTRGPRLLPRQPVSTN